MTIIILVNILALIGSQSMDVYEHNYSNYFKLALELLYDAVKPTTVHGKAHGHKVSR